MQDALKAQGGVMVSKDFPEDKVIQAFQGEDVPDPHFWFVPRPLCAGSFHHGGYFGRKASGRKKLLLKREKEAYQKELEELKA